MKKKEKWNEACRREKALARGGVESSSEPAPPPVEDAASVTEPEPSKNDPLASEIESIAPSPANTSPSATEQVHFQFQTYLSFGVRLGMQAFTVHNLAQYSLNEWNSVRFKLVSDVRQNTRDTEAVCMLIFFDPG